MKITNLILASVPILALAGCSTTHEATTAKPGAETVMVTYHVKAGQEAALQEELSRAWAVYQDGKLVYDRPHLILRAKADVDKPKFTEIFTWAVSPDDPSHAVLAEWKAEQALCEARDGRPGIEIEMVERVK